MGVRWLTEEEGAGNGAEDKHLPKRTKTQSCSPIRWPGPEVKNLLKKSFKNARQNNASPLIRVLYFDAKPFVYQLNDEMTRSFDPLPHAPLDRTEAVWLGYPNFWRCLPKPVHKWLIESLSQSFLGHTGTWRHPGVQCSIFLSNVIIRFCNAARPGWDLES